MVLPALPKEAQRSPSPTLKLDDSVRKRFSGLIRRQTRRLDPVHPTFSLDLATREAAVCGFPWPLESEDTKVRDDAAALVAFWDAYRSAFRGRIEKLQRDYFIFLCWMFFSPFICTLRRQASLEGRDVIRFPRVGIVFGKSNSGKTQLVEIAGKFMFAEHFQGAIRTRLTTQHLRAIDASYRRMPAFFDDVGWTRFAIMPRVHQGRDALAPRRGAVHHPVDERQDGELPRRDRQAVPPHLQRRLASER